MVGNYMFNGPFHGSSLWHRPGTYRKEEFGEKLNSYDEFLGTFVILRDATMSFVVSVRASIRVKQHGFHWMDFYEIWLLFFEILTRKLEFY